MMSSVVCRCRTVPPNTLLVVQRLVKPELLVEIEAVAQVGAA